MRERRTRGGTSTPPGARPASLGSTSSPDAFLEEERLRNVQKEIEEEARARRRAEAGQGSSASAPPSPSRFWPGVRQAAKKVLGVGQEGAACDSQEVAPFAEMEQAMTGLMDLSHEKADPLHGGVMDDTVILASGYTADQPYQQWFISQKNVYPFTGHSLPQSLTVPNHTNSDSFHRRMVTDESMTGLINHSHKKVEPIRLSHEVAIKWPHGNSLNQSYEQWCISQKDNCLPNGVAVKWSLDDDDGIPYPLYAEFCGETISSSERREWTDVKLVRKLRGLCQQERLASRNHFKLRLTWPGTRRKSSSLFMVAMDKLNNEKQKNEYSEGREVPEYLLCPLSCELMVGPVTIATGKTFERRVLKDWFKKNGHICPVTGELVSSTILRNDRVKGYLEEWAEAKAEGTTKFRDGNK